MKSNVLLLIAATLLLTVLVGCQKPSPNSSAEQIPKAPDLGYKIAYRLNSAVCVVGMDGLNPYTILSDSSYPGYEIVDWSPDGNNLAVYYSGNIWLYCDSSCYQVSGLGYGNNYGSWSHSGRYLVRGLYFDGIYRHDVETQTTIKLYNTLGYTYDHDPVYSPDDSRIAYIHHEYGGLAWIRVIDADGSNMQTISDTIYTSYNHNLYLNWIGEYEIIYYNNNYLIPNPRNTCRASYLLTFGPDTSFTIELSQYRFNISPNHQYYYYRDNVDLYCGEIGIWANNPLSADLNAIYSWSPESNGLASISATGIWWTTLNGDHSQVMGWESGTPHGISLAL